MVPFGGHADGAANRAPDVVSMRLGVRLAHRLPVRIGAAIAHGFEVPTAQVFRDGPTRDVLMLARPLDAVRGWQGAV